MWVQQPNVETVRGVISNGFTFLFSLVRIASFFSSRGFYIVPTKAASPYAKGPLKKLPPSSKSKSSAASSSENSITTTSRDKKPKPDKGSSRTGKSKKLNAETTSTEEVKSTTPTSSSVSPSSEETDPFNEVSTANTQNDAGETTTESNEDTTSVDITEDDFEELLAGNQEADSTDSRFVSNGTEINFSEENTASSTATSSTTTDMSKYRFIYKVPRPKKDAQHRR